ncbi:MAG: ABC transporter permease [Clostridiales bacterium]|nr:ABC transporter permease [Clostridiales bacterium]
MTKIYRNLAGNALSKNKIIYVPYIISSMVMIAITFILSAISQDKQLRQVEGGATLQVIMSVGIPIMLIIAFFFLMGVSRFVIKQRKKELGVYCILGMQKKHIIRLQFLENLYVYLLSIVSGTVIGFVIEKIVQLLFLKMYHLEADFSWNIQWKTLILITVAFAVFFLVFFIINAIGILTSNILEYMKEESKGEKQPKSKWILAIVGLIFLGSGYALSLNTKEGLKAIQYFGIAVALVIFGTFALFTAGSITLLNSMKKNKKFYYKTGHFISISGMLYRMKRNAANLATICIFATMVLVTMSSVTTLYSTINKLANEWYVTDFEITYVKAKTQAERDERESLLREAAEKTGVSIEQIYTYQSIDAFATVENGVISTAPSYRSDDISHVFIITEDVYDYVHETKLNLAKDEVGLFTSASFSEDTIRFQPMTEDYELSDAVSPDFRVRRIDDTPKINTGGAVMMTNGHYVLVVSDESVFESLKPYMCESSWIIDTERERVLINTSSSKQAQLAMYDELDQNWPTYKYDWVTCKIDRVDELMGLYGGLFFLGAFLSIAFLTITILNMYFSQLQQGYEDAKRFAIMRKVGLTRKEIKKSINSQIVVVFLLPLIVAVIHTAASYPMVNKILNLLGGCDASSFLLIVLICCLLFAVVYTIAYLFTRRTYLKMVSGAYDGK